MLPYGALKEAIRMCVKETVKAEYVATKLLEE